MKLASLPIDRLDRLTPIEREVWLCAIKHRDTDGWFRKTAAEIRTHVAYAIKRPCGASAVRKACTRLVTIGLLGRTEKARVGSAWRVRRKVIGYVTEHTIHVPEKVSAWMNTRRGNDKIAKVWLRDGVPARPPEQGSVVTHTDTNRPLLDPTLRAGVGTYEQGSVGAIEQGSTTAVCINYLLEDLRDDLRPRWGRRPKTARATAGSLSSKNDPEGVTLPTAAIVDLELDVPQPAPVTAATEAAPWAWDDLDLGVAAPPPPPRPYKPTSAEVADPEPWRRLVGPDPTLPHPESDLAIGLARQLLPDDALWIVSPTDTYDRLPVESLARIGEVLIPPPPFFVLDPTTDDERDGSITRAWCARLIAARYPRDVASLKKVRLSSRDPGWDRIGRLLRDARLSPAIWAWHICRAWTAAKGTAVLTTEKAPPVSMFVGGKDAPRHVGWARREAEQYLPGANTRTVATASPHVRFYRHRLLCLRMSLGPGSHDPAKIRAAILRWFPRGLYVEVCETAYRAMQERDDWSHRARHEWIWTEHAPATDLNVEPK